MPGDGGSPGLGETPAAEAPGPRPWFAGAMPLPANKSANAAACTQWAETLARHVQRCPSGAELDAFGQVARVREYPDGGAGPGLDTHYAHDHAGRLVRILPAATGVATTIAYDTLGRKRSLDDPDSGRTTWSRDANGNLATQTDARGREARFAYDGLDRLVSSTTVQAPGDTRATYVWDDVASGGPNARKTANVIASVRDAPLITRNSGLPLSIEKTG